MIDAYVLGLAVVGMGLTVILYAMGLLWLYSRP